MSSSHQFSALVTQYYYLMHLIRPALARSAKAETNLLPLPGEIRAPNPFLRRFLRQFISIEFTVLMLESPSRRMLPPRASPHHKQ
jgi:hypothetical protein